MSNSISAKEYLEKYTDNKQKELPKRMSAKDYNLLVAKESIESIEGKHKYNAKGYEVDGILFPSKKEANRYVELKVLEKQGLIKDLKLQPRFVIIPKQVYRGKTIRQAVYTADFEYKDVAGNHVIEEVKGYKTTDYILRKKLFLLHYGDKYLFKEL